MVALFGRRTPTTSVKGDPGPWKKRLRILRRVLVGILTVLVGLILLLAVVLFLRPTREGLLSWGVRLADDALPGSLTVGRAGWPSLGRLVLEDVLWVSDLGEATPDTLADVAVLDLALDLAALKSREGQIESLLVDARRVDIPAIVVATATTGGKAAADSMTAPADSLLQDFPFFQRGSLPGFPSAILGQLDLEVDRAVLAPGLALRDLVLVGRADVRGDRPATAVIDHIETRFLTTLGDTVGAPVWEVDLDHLGFGLRLEGTADATGAWTMGAADLDSLNLVIAPVAHPDLPEPRWISSPVTLKATAGIDRNGPAHTGRLDCDFVLPGTARFHHWLPDSFPHEEFDSTRGHLVLTGNYAASLAEVALRLDLGANTWLEKGVVAGQASADLDALRARGIGELTARLDTLDIDLKGIQVAASGDWGPETVGLKMDLALTDFYLPSLFLTALRPDLQEVWQDADPVGLTAALDMGRRDKRYQGTLGCDFLLPGAEHFRSWLPENFPVDEMDSLQGRLDAAANYDGVRAGGNLRLDLGSNTWMDKGLVAGDAQAVIDSLRTGGLRALTAHLDTLEVALRGVEMSASGILEPGLLTLDLHTDLRDFQMPTQVIEPRLAGAVINLQAKASVTGSLEEPEIDAHVAGGMLQETIVLPAVDLRLKGDRRNVVASLQAGGGLTFEGTSLDSIRAEVAGRMVARDSLDANFSLAVWQEGNGLAVGGAVRGDTLREVQIDSLVLRAFAEEMRIQEPVTLTLGPGPGVFDLTALNFSGEPGSVTARGYWNDEGMDLAAGVDLLLPESLLQLVVPSPFWSVNGGVDLKLDAQAGLVGGEVDPEVVGKATAVLRPHRDDPPFGVDLDFKSQGGEAAALNAEFSVTSAQTPLLQAQLDWPGIAGPEAGFWRPDPDQDLTLTVPPQKFDLKRLNQRLPSEVALKGIFDIAGEVHVFPPGKREEVDDPSAPNSLRGTVAATLGTPDLRVDLPNRSWLKTTVDASFSGALADPKLVARVEVTEGFIRIPEMARNLHPIQGESLLWALNDSLLAAMDSTVADSLAAGLGVGRTEAKVVFVPSSQTGPALESKGPAFLPELDLELVIRDELRVIGYGVDLKLGGKVKVARGVDEKGLPGPAVTGDIRSPEGTVKVMNRVFKIERGNLKFTGSVPSNPRFDMMLESQVNNYLVRVLISGQASNPVIELTSEPDLSEEDIMAVLLFGQPMNDLDNDQRGRMSEENDPNKELQKNLAGLAMAFGAKGLQDSMSDSFGVDMVQMGSDSKGGSTLVVGKFITPDIILKYNQSLEKSGTYFMTLEYSLNRYFKLVSTYGQGEEASGAELRWTRRY